MGVLLGLASLDSDDAAAAEVELSAPAAAGAAGAAAAGAATKARLMWLQISPKSIAVVDWNYGPGGLDIEDKKVLAPVDAGANLLLKIETVRSSSSRWRQTK